MGDKATYEELEKRIEELEKLTSESLKMAENFTEDEGYLRAILDGTPFPAALVDSSDNKILYWSRSALSLFGHTASTSTELYDLAYPDPSYRKDVIRRWRHCVEEARNSGEPVNGGVYKVTCHDGSVRLCELYAAFCAENLVVTFRDVTNERKAQDALLERTRFIDKVIESSAVSTWISDDRGTAIRANPACLAFFGATEEEVVGHYNLFKDSVIEKAGIMPGIRDVFSKGIPASFILDYDFGAVDHVDVKNATHKTVNSIFTPILDEAGKVSNVMVQTIDLTEIKATEAALRKSEERLRLIIRGSNDAPWDWDLKTNEIYYSPQWWEQIGYAPDELPPDHALWQKLLNPLDEPRVEEVLEAVHSGGISSYEVEFRLKHKDGHYVPLLSRSYVTRDESGEAVRVTGTNMNLTERKQAERALAEEKKRLLVTLRSIGDGFITTDTKGNITLMNKVAQELTGWSLKEALGKNVDDVFALRNIDDSEPVDNPVGRVLKTQQIVGPGIPEILISRGGKESTITSTASPIVSEDGELAGSVLIFRDVTLQHALEKRLQQSDRIESIGILAGGIAHDFNNLLAVITGNVSFVLEDLNEQSELFAVLSDAMTGAHQAQKLTQQLLTFAKGGTPIRVKSDLNDLIRESTQFILSGTKTRCEYDLADDLWAVNIDNGQICQVINNTVINADQALSDGGTIQIKTWNRILSIDESQIIGVKSGAYTCVSIKDQGAGIAAEDLAKIFDPYFSTKPRGSGLGLATAYSIISHHLGSIEVESIEGRGTEVTILLPAVQEVSPGVSPETPVISKGGGRILIMDDQESLLKMVSRMLKALGYDVSCARDGKEAVELFRGACQGKNPFDLVILDLTVPGGMGGAEALSALRAIDPEVRAIVSSGYSNDPVMANFREHGFCGVIPKPYSRKELAECLNSVLNNEE